MVTFVPQVSLQRYFQFLFLNVLLFFIQETDSFKTVLPLSWSFRKTSKQLFSLKILLLHSNSTYQKYSLVS